MAVGSGGAVLSPSTKRRLAEMLPGRIVADAFGSSETGQLGGRAPDDDPYGAPRLHVDERTDVLDDELRPVLPGSGVVGRLARSGHIPIGYLGDADKTAATFVEVAAASVGRFRATWPRSDADGAITVLGRGSLCINTGGEKVFPDEVEAAVKSDDEVEDVVVVGVPDERYGERVVAVVQPRAGCQIDAEALRASCRGRLAGYKVPRQIVVIDAITRIADRQARLSVGQGDRHDDTGRRGLRNLWGNHKQSMNNTGRRDDGRRCPRDRGAWFWFRWVRSTTDGPPAW